MKTYLALYPNQTTHEFRANNLDAAWCKAEKLGPPEDVVELSLPSIFISQETHFGNQKYCDC